MNFAVRGLPEAGVGLCPEHADQSLHVLKKSASRLEWLHVNLVGLDCVVLFEGPDVLHKCLHEIVKL